MLAALLSASAMRCVAVQAVLLQLCGQIHVHLLQLLLRFFAIILTASSSNPWIFIPAAVVIVAFLALRSYYLKTSRDVKRLEAIGDHAAMSELLTVVALFNIVRL